MISWPAHAGDQKQRSLRLEAFLFAAKRLLKAQKEVGNQPLALRSRDGALDIH